MTRPVPLGVDIEPYEFEHADLFGSDQNGGPYYLELKSRWAVVEPS